MKILVITACTAKKKFDRQVDRPNQLQPEDFSSPERLNRRTHELRRYETPAAQMYKGPGHLRVMNGVKNLRHRFRRGVIDVGIISPGYGLLDEHKPIVPYDYDFKGLGEGEIRYRGKELRIR
jgi:hypothetical protein